MSILDELNSRLRLAASEQAASQSEIDELLRFSAIEVPTEYIEIIRDKTEVELSVDDKKYIRIWSPSGVIEMNDAYRIQKYIPLSLAIGDDEGGSVYLYANGKNGFGVYKVSLGDLDIQVAKYISRSLNNMLLSGEGIDNL